MLRQFINGKRKGENTKAKELETGGKRKRAGAFASSSRKRTEKATKNGEESSDDAN
jgi:hypothetical protein